LENASLLDKGTHERPRVAVRRVDLISPVKLSRGNGGKRELRLVRRNRSRLHEIAKALRNSASVKIRSRRTGEASTQKEENGHKGVIHEPDIIKNIQKRE